MRGRLLGATARKRGAKAQGRRHGPVHGPHHATPRFLGPGDGPGRAAVARGGPAVAALPPGAILDARDRGNPHPEKEMVVGRGRGGGRAERPHRATHTLGVGYGSLGDVISLRLSRGVG